MICNVFIAKEKTPAISPSLNTNFCDKNITNLNGSTLHINNSAGKNAKYVFLFTPIQNNQTISFNSNSPTVTLTDVPYLQYNTSYIIWATEITDTDTIEVQMPPCVLTISEPVTNITINQASITNFDDKTNNPVQVTPVAKASYYEFIFSDAGLNKTIVYSKTGILTNNSLRNLKNNNYNVSVKVYIDNSAGPLITSIQQLNVAIN